MMPTCKRTLFFIVQRKHMWALWRKLTLLGVVFVSDKDVKPWIIDYQYITMAACCYLR